METGVTVEKAIEIACQSPLSKLTEIKLLDEAIDRILATDLISKVNDPRFDNSSMDGWAVNSEDCLTMNTKLKIKGVSKAGQLEKISIERGEACKIMTGAPIPNGANAIVMVEDTNINDNVVSINGPARVDYIRKKGENIKKGQVTMFSGTLINSSAISLAATMGHDRLEVISKPKIAIISNGDELIQPGLSLSDGQIYESNSFGISALIKKMGGEPIRFNAVQDSLEGLRNALNSAVLTCDAVITSGGVSMGDWDLVRKIMEDEGDIKFWRVLMRPGGPPLFGKWKNKPLFALPGNPVSSHVVFTMLVAPWMSQSLGMHPEYGPKIADRVSVILQQPLKGAPNKLCLRRIRITNQNGKLIAKTHTHQGSGNIHSMLVHNAISLLPPDTDAIEGDQIEALWFR